MKNSILYFYEHIFFNKFKFHIFVIKIIDISNWYMIITISTIFPVSTRIIFYTFSIMLYLIS